MCKDASNSGHVQGGGSGTLRTGIEMCQRSGVFINSTDQAATVTSQGIAYTVPVGKSATVPVGPQIDLDIPGDGLLVWSVTSAVLSPELTDAPHAQPGGLRPAPAPATQVLIIPESVTGVYVTLSSGNYSKLQFISAGGANS